MGESKINISVGNVAFSGEGEQAWLAEQLDKVLKAAPAIARQPSASEPKGDQVPPATKGGSFTTTLAAHIRAKNGEANQVNRFLATADWLRRRGTKLSTAAVRKALSDNHQKRLANPADCLNKNVAKGMCEKTNDGFFITPDGLRQLGYKDGA